MAVKANCDSTFALLYLGVIATGLAWLIRFRILTVNGLVFQTQVAYLYSNIWRFVWIFSYGRNHHMESFNLFNNNNISIYIVKK